jgi:hypothetical protein
LAKRHPYFIVVPDKFRKFASGRMNVSMGIMGEVPGQVKPGSRPVEPIEDTERLAGLEPPRAGSGSVKGWPAAGTRRAGNATALRR